MYQWDSKPLKTTRSHIWRVSCFSNSHYTSKFKVNVVAGRNAWKKCLQREQTVDEPLKVQTEEEEEESLCHFESGEAAAFI